MLILLGLFHDGMKAFPLMHFILDAFYITVTTIEGLLVSLIYIFSTSISNILEPDKTNIYS